jgi:hypothetical protein
MIRMTGQVLCELLRSPNGFILSVLSVNLTSRASLPNSRHMGVEILPLLAIGRVPQLAIIFRAITRCMLGH